MKKYKKYLILFLISAFTGVFFSFLYHSGFMEKFFLSIKSIKWYYYLPLIIFIFFLNILIHELGHLISLLINGIKIRALYVLIFIVHKDFDNKWKFKIRLKNLQLLGGLVVPNFNEITNEDKFNKVSTAFKKAIIAGPRTSILYLVLSILSFLIIFIFTNSYILIGLNFLNMILTIILTTIIILSSKVKTDELYGDYQAYKMFNESEKFTIMQVFQYYMFSLNDYENTSKFFYNYINNFYRKKIFTYSIIDITLAKNMLELYVYNDNYKSNHTVKKIINHYNINRLSRNKHGLELAYLISATYYKLNKLNKAYETFNLIQLNKNRHLSKDEQTLLKKTYAHLINLEINNDYFKNSKQMIMDQLFILKPLVNIDELIKELSYKLKYKEYYTKLYCNIKEK